MQQPTISAFDVGSPVSPTAIQVYLRFDDNYKFLFSNLLLENSGMF